MFHKIQKYRGIRNNIHIDSDMKSLERESAIVIKPRLREEKWIEGGTSTRLIFISYSNSETPFIGTTLAK